MSSPPRHSVSSAPTARGLQRPGCDGAKKKTVSLAPLGPLRVSVGISGTWLSRRDSSRSENPADASADPSSPLSALPCICLPTTYWAPAAGGGAGACLPCPEAATCVLNQIFSAEGFWRASAGDTRVFACRPGRCLSEYELQASSAPGDAARGGGRRRAPPRIDAAALDERRWRRRPLTFGARASFPPCRRSTARQRRST